MAGHSPLGEPDFGYLAYSIDLGETWQEVPDTWDKPSPLIVRMFINMGMNYEGNTDGYVYALAMGAETGWTPDGDPDFEDGTVYLMRVPVGEVLDFHAYEYLTAVDDGGDPTWAEDDPDAATPLKGLVAHEMGGAVYHSGADRYLFMTARPGALFEASNPWGPWVQVARILEPGAAPSWEDGSYIPNFITEGMGVDSFYFSVSSGGYYNLNMAKVDLTYQA
ncbi:MAG: DUF4185 domain-containing protein, partial [Proteobacteria bacterium]|nr:DUF4185 domain-containing protein [Pseudomonadota bacterium]